MEFCGETTRSGTGRLGLGLTPGAILSTSGTDVCGTHSPGCCRPSSSPAWCPGNTWSPAGRLLSRRADSSPSRRPHSSLSTGGTAEDSGNGGHVSVLNHSVVKCLICQKSPMGVLLSFSISTGLNMSINRIE